MSLKNLDKFLESREEKNLENIQEGESLWGVYRYADANKGYGKMGYYVDFIYAKNEKDAESQLEDLRPGDYGYGVEKVNKNKVKKEIQEKIEKLNSLLGKL
jgi:hypothetical protein